MRKTSKIKRILAGLLALILTVALLPAQTARIAKADPMPTIDTSKTGSLTIHKYEYNGAGGIAGTGSESDLIGSTLIGGVIVGTSTDSPDDKAIPLANVKFKVSYVAALSTYYGIDGLALPTVADAKITIGTGTELTGTTDFTPTVGEFKYITTDSSGEASLSNLPLGLYLVQEVEAPAQITEKAADFLVSIPMTNATEDDWLYDVHVFPKNKSTYASVTLQKMGKIGDNAAEVLPYAYFVLEIKDEVAGTWSRVTTNNKGNTIGTTVGTENNVLTTGADGKITVSDLAPGLYCFREIGAPDNSGYIVDTLTRHQFRIKDDGLVYLFTGDTENASETDTASDPITVINYKPDAEKDVKDRGGNWDNDADYSIGDKIPYRIKVDVPENVASLRSFKISDTLTNQEYVDGSLKIYSDNTFTTQILNSTVPDVDSGKRSWFIEFNSFTSGSTGDPGTSSLLATYKNTSIYIYFEAKLTSNAVNLSDGNPNKIDLSYSNKIVPDTEATAPKEDIIHDEAVVYAFKIAVEKQGESESIKLKDVEFDLYRKINTGEDTTGLTVSTDPVKGLTGDFVKVNSSSLKTNENGEVSADGLENGTYYLVETKTNDGYNLLKEPVEITINVSYTTRTTTTTTTTDGVTTTKTEVTIDSFTGGDSNTGVYKTIIKNSKGFTLPTTGGIGSAIFVFVGVSMMVAAVILFFVSRKKENEKTKQ